MGMRLAPGTIHMTVMTKLKSAAAAVAIMVVASAGAASAATFSGSGYWGSGTPTTAYSAANEVFTFGFDIPDTFSGTANSDGIDTTDFSDFFYYLNGVQVAATPTDIDFYTAASHGMFDLNFSDATVSLYGADVASTGTVVAGGNFPSTAGINDVFPGTGAGAVDIAITPSAPEPASWALMLGGVGFAGLALRRRRRVAETAFLAA